MIPSGDPYAMKFIGELPPGVWQARKLPDGRIVYACEDHMPRVYSGGKLSVIEITNHETWGSA